MVDNSINKTNCIVIFSQQRLFSHSVTGTASMCGGKYLEDCSSCGSNLPVKTATDEANVCGGSNSHWNLFKKEFETQLVSSEREMQQAEFQKLHEEVLVAALGMVGQDQQEAINAVQRWSSSTGQAGSELLDVRADSDVAPVVPCPSHQTAPSSPRPLPARQHHGILHSSKYERVSELELDLVLEAIEEESERSREGSHSPATMTNTK